MTRTPISERDRELVKAPPVAAQFPVAFENGPVWSHFSGQCNGCGCDVHPDSLRGLVTRPIPTVFQLEAVGICGACKLLTRYQYRFHHDSRITGLDRQGRWRSWIPQKPTLLQRLRRFFLS